MAVNPIPKGYHAVTPYLIIRGAASAIEFYRKAFNAAELMRFAGPDGKIMHAEIKIGDSQIMLADEMPDVGYVGPQSLNGTTVGFHIYVQNVDQWFTRALAAGAKELRPVQDQFYGDRSGTLLDPYGHMWTIATHVEDVGTEELRRRAEASMS